MESIKRKLEGFIETIVLAKLNDKEQERKKKGTSDYDILCLSKKLSALQEEKRKTEAYFWEETEKQITYFKDLIERISGLESAFDQNLQDRYLYQEGVNIGLCDLAQRLTDIENVFVEQQIITRLIQLEKRMIENKLKFSEEFKIKEESVLKQIAQLHVIYNELVENQQTSINRPKEEKKLRHINNEYESIDYFDFEDHFRGGRKDIKNRLRIYLPYFESKSSVIDLGCGRGEFLELMKDNGISAMGIDIYDQFVEYCKLKNLAVVKGDAIEFLRASEDVDGIFAGQLIEHLELPQLLELCDLAYIKLKKGGQLIMETPNPTSLAIYTNSFYIDPSHEKPVHPAFIHYCLKKAGFEKVQILYPEESKIQKYIPDLRSSEIENIKEFNLAIQEVSNLLYGSQDYAVIATKE